MVSQAAYTDADLHAAWQAHVDTCDGGATTTAQIRSILDAVAPAIAARALRELADRLEGVFAEVLVEMIRARADDIETER